MPGRLRLRKFPLLSMPWPSPQAKMLRVDLHHCGSELSKSDLVDLRSRYDITTSVVLRHPKATDRAHAPPPGLRNLFVVALNNGLRLSVHSYIGEVLSMAGIGPARLTPNMWISIIGLNPNGGVFPHVLLAMHPEGWPPLFHNEDTDEGLL
ncbi:hypothetical protein LIER_28656 [Lithospermum erythrorhizon]|uniref:Uncharacterized protein n=1 Tax=Lithospermum erythrorhizon TaxID=34254 RepID=A0AAV3RK09_LITER